jgi:predicted ArsR family transcriptional regulator
VGQKKEMEYAYYSNDKGLLDKLNEANVGIKTYRKVEATVRRMGWDSFTTAQLANQLSVTDRNIRRIMASLCKVALVECIGEESPSNRGRPSRKYRLEF